MLICIFVLIIAGCLAAVHRWRWGVYAAIIIALIQDPLRKLIPGVPGYLAMCSVPVWGVAVAMAIASGECSIDRFMRSFPKFRQKVRRFGVYLIIPAALSVSYGKGSWQITILGAFVYLGAFFMLAMAWVYSTRQYFLKRVFIFYTCICSLLLLGGPLDYLGLGNACKMIGSEAMGKLWVTYRMGSDGVFMYSGFFRSPDVMGWHAAMVLMISSILALISKGWVRAFWICVALWGFLNVWICGRRKMLAMMPVFLFSFLFMVAKFKGLKHVVLIFTAVSLIAGGTWYMATRDHQETEVDAFYGSTLNDFEERLKMHGVGAVVETVRQAGFLGYGLGMGQQGVHNIKCDKPRLWQEGGPGKVIVELGIPGGVLLVLMAVTLVFTAYHVVGSIEDSSAFYTMAGALSILAANASSSLISAQIFGDLFVLMFLVFILGSILGIVRANRKQLSVEPSLLSVFPTDESQG